MVCAADTCLSVHWIVLYPAEAPPALCLEKWQRVARRVASMILQLFSLEVRDELVPSKRLLTFGILTYLLVTYSLGGVFERQNLLCNLEDPPEIQNVLDGPIALRRWLLWRTRTKEIGVIAPDTALQLKGLLKMTKKNLGKPSRVAILGIFDKIRIASGHNTK